MAPHSSTLAWRIQWMEEPGRLQSMRRVGGLLGVAGRLSGTVSPFRAEQGTSLVKAGRTSRVQGSGPLPREGQGPADGKPLGSAPRSLLPYDHR